eukprot:g1065.t1
MATCARRDEDAEALQRALEESQHAGVDFHAQMLRAEADAEATVRARELAEAEARDAALAVAAGEDAATAERAAAIVAPRSSGAAPITYGPLSLSDGDHDDDDDDNDEDAAEQEEPPAAAARRQQPPVWDERAPAPAPARLPGFNSGLRQLHAERAQRAAQRESARDEARALQELAQRQADEVEVCAAIFGRAMRVEQRPRGADEGAAAAAAAVRSRRAG